MPRHPRRNAPPPYALGKTLTISPAPPSPASFSAVDPQALALAALVWVLADDERAGRLLALTGLTPDHLRAGLRDPQVLAAVLEFLCAHEPDLLAAADALDVAPAALPDALARLAR